MKHLIYIPLMITLCLSMSCQEVVELSTDASEVIYVRRDGADMAAYIRGNTASKTFVIIVHGGPGGNGLEYRNWIFKDQLERDFAFVYWDQRGQGGSHGNFGEEQLTIANMVDDLEALIRALNIRYGEEISTFVLGHSWGGMLSAAFMVEGDNQFLIDGWIEVSGAHDIPLLNQEAIKMFREIGQGQIDQGKNVDRWQEIVEFANGVDINNISVEEGGQINSYGFEAEGLLDEVSEGPDWIPSPSTLSYFFSPTNPLSSGVSGQATSNGLLEEVEQSSFTDQLHRIEIPCLFLWGKYDFVVPPALAQSAFDRVSSTDKTIFIFNSSGHSPMDSEPRIFGEILYGFVETHR